MLILPLTMAQLHLLTQLGKFQWLPSDLAFIYAVSLLPSWQHLPPLLYSVTYCLTALTCSIVFSHLLLDDTYLIYCIQPLTAWRHLPPLLFSATYCLTALTSTIVIIHLLWPTTAAYYSRISWHNFAVGNLFNIIDQ